MERVHWRGRSCCLSCFSHVAASFKTFSSIVSNWSGWPKFRAAFWFGEQADWCDGGCLKSAVITKCQSTQGTRSFGQKRTRKKPKRPSKPVLPLLWRIPTPPETHDGCKGKLRKSTLMSWRPLQRSGALRLLTSAWVTGREGHWAAS